MSTVLANRLNFKHLGSLITIGDQALGYLWSVPGKGVFEPTLGRVEIDPKFVQTHNIALDQALVDGLDRCEVGQRGSFYFVAGKVQTWLGKLVSDDCRLSGKVLTFRRNGAIFRGTLKKCGDLFNFRRVA
jgi:hypothetical protein